MDSRLVVFVNGTADYLQVRSRTDKLIRGWVINGHWEMVIDLEKKMVFIDLSYKGDGTFLESLSAFERIDIVEMNDGPDDYNLAIDRARAILDAAETTDPSQAR